MNQHKIAALCLLAQAGREDIADRLYADGWNAEDIAAYLAYARHARESTEYALSAKLATYILRRWNV